MGAAEILCGGALMALPHARWRGAKNGANWALVGVKVLNAYSHWAVDDEFERTAPTLVFLLMLGCRLVVDWQVAKREREQQALQEQHQQQQQQQSLPAAAAKQKIEQKKDQ